MGRSASSRRELVLLDSKRFLVAFVNGGYGRARLPYALQLLFSFSHPVLSLFPIFGSCAVLIRSLQRFLPLLLPISGIIAVAHNSLRSARLARSLHCLAYCRTSVPRAMLRAWRVITGAHHNGTSYDLEYPLPLALPLDSGRAHQRHGRRL
jgi:hypothetical protein